MTKGDKKRRFTQFDPTDPTVNFYFECPLPSHGMVGSTLPFDTREFVLFVSDQSLGDEVAVKLPPIPYAEPAGAYSSFRNPRWTTGNRIGTSMAYPVTQLLLQNSELDPEIIAEKKPIYLGVSPDQTAPKNSASTWAHQRPSYARPKRPTSASRPDDDVSGDENRGRRDHRRPERPRARRQVPALFPAALCERFFRGSRLTSEQLHAAIDANAPIGVRTDLLDRRETVTAVRKHFGIVMDRKGERNGGKNHKFWQDYEVRLYQPDSLEKKWL